MAPQWLSAASSHTAPTMSNTTSTTAMMTRTSSITIEYACRSLRRRLPRRAFPRCGAAPPQPFTGFTGGVTRQNAEKQCISWGSSVRSWFSIASRTCCSSSCELISVSLPLPGLVVGRPLQWRAIRPQAFVSAYRRLRLRTARRIPSLRQRPQTGIPAINHFSASPPTMQAGGRRYSSSLVTAKKSGTIPGALPGRARPRRRP